MQLLNHVLLIVILWNKNVLEARQFSLRYYDDEQAIQEGDSSTVTPPWDPFNFVATLLHSVSGIHQFFVKAIAKYIFPEKKYATSRNLTLYRSKRQVRRKFIVKCCGRQTCSQGSRKSAERRQESKRKVQEETQLVDQLQYQKPKKKKMLRKKPVTANLHAFGVMTDQGIHISCAGCPAGWPDMLTVYPEYEIGIPVTCSNCPKNWPGALNLLGVGGDPSWASVDGNNFFGFQPANNFGHGFAPDNKVDFSGDEEKNVQSTQFFVEFSTSAATESTSTEVVTLSEEVVATTLEAEPPAQEEEAKSDGAEEEKKSDGAEEEKKSNGAEEAKKIPEDPLTSFLSAFLKS